MSVSFNFSGGDGFEKLFAGKQALIANAAQQALVACGDKILTEGRASIASGGFSAAWQDALHVTVYPKQSGGGSIDVRHGIPYAMVFEQGATIEGQPLLWLPLPSCPPEIGGRKATPRAYTQSIGQLQFVQGKTHPLLVGKTSQPPKEPAPAGVMRLSGPRVEKVSSLRSGAKSGGYDVPMFFGIQSVTITKKFDVLGVVERAYADLAASFSANLKEG
jgi:hypothetical protein